MILRCITICLIFFLSACTPKSQVHHEQLIGFGTLIEIKIWGTNAQQGSEVVAQLAQDFEHMHESWHPWESGPLAQTNQRLTSGEKFSPPPNILPLILKSAELSRLSKGKFNPAIGQLIKLWGFNSSEPPKGSPPSPEMIEDFLSKKPSMTDISINGLEISSRNPALTLDFGGFAKGYGVDLAIETLKRNGFHNAIVNAGGDLRAIGSHGERPWRIGIKNPRGPGMLASVDVREDESIFTSGDYERFFESEGIRFHHILNPETGYPARGTVSVTVFHKSAADADAAATALFVAGPEEWYETAKALKVHGVILVDTRGTVHMTPGLKQRVHIDLKPAPKIVYSQALE